MPFALLAVPGGNLLGLLGEMRRKSVHGSTSQFRASLPRRLVGDDLELEPTRLLSLLSGLSLYASIYVLVRLAISLFILATNSDSERDLEILALRHQVAVPRRQVKRPELVSPIALSSPLWACDCRPGG
jgi:hypothetical protein